MTINVINGVRFINKEELTKAVINIFVLFVILLLFFSGKVSKILKPLILKLEIQRSIRS